MHIRSRTSAFTLIEIVIAVAIIAFALVGILGLFPTALNSAADSQTETQAAFIAQRIFSNLGSQVPFIQKDGASMTDVTLVDLSKEGEYQMDFDEAGLLPNTPKEERAKTTGQPVYRVTLFITPDDTLTSLENKLTRAQITIRTPVVNKKENQKTYSFVTLLDTDPKALTATP
jgi:uncharacterized protein (TIGR02598 family)